jgi:hypothetical protein
VIDGRLAGLKRFFADFIELIVKRGLAIVAGREDPEASLVRKWLHELSTLAQSDSVSETQVSEIARTYGLGAAVKGGLFEVLEGTGSFSWQESRRAGGSVTRVTAVTTELMQKAISQTLGQLAQWTKLLVVVFFDDVDQLRGDPLATAVRHVLGIEGCVRVVHVRAESLDDDIRRETQHWFEVPAMTSAELVEMVERRMRAVRERDRAWVQSDAVRAVVQRLAEQTGNPLVLLRWITYFAQSGALDEDRIARWCEREMIDRAAQVGFTPVPTSFLKRVAAAIDGLAPSAFGSHTKEQLDVALDEGAFEQAVRVGALLPTGGDPLRGEWRLHAELDLLRPQVIAKLAAS